jgi:hypothetical protein
VDGPNGALLGRYINGATTPQMPTYPGAPANMLSGPALIVGSPPVPQFGSGDILAAPASVVDTELSVPTEATGSVVAGPVAAVSERAAATAVGAVSRVDVLSRRSELAGTAGVSRQAADGLFTALARGVVDPDELTVLGDIADPGAQRASIAEASEGGSGQADLDRLLWESGDSSWLDG